MQTDPLYEYDFSIPAGGKSPIKVIESKYFYLLNLSHSRVALRVNNGKLRTGGRARGHNYARVEDFYIEKVEVINLDPSLELTGILQVGEGDPIDNIFQIDAEEVTPTLRDEIPSIIAEEKSLSSAGIGSWKLLLPANEFRAEVRLSTTATTAAYWAPAISFDISEGRNIVTAGGLEGVVTIRSKSAIYVWHTEAATEIRATEFKFA